MLEALESFAEPLPERAPVVTDRMAIGYGGNAPFDGPLQAPDDSLPMGRTDILDIRAHQLVRHGAGLSAKAATPQSDPFVEPQNFQPPDRGNGGRTLRFNISERGIHQ